MHFRTGMAALALMASAGCAESYAYRPEQHAGARLAGHSAALYEIAQGDVRIASFGISKFRTAHSGDVDMKAMHVRMVIANNSERPWSVDTGNLVAEYRGAGDPVHAVHVRADSVGLPIIPIAQHGQRTIDLFYPLPPGLQSEDKIPEFDLLWKVDTGGTIVAERTPFERLRVEPTYASAGGNFPSTAFGPYYWYDPFWGPGWFGSPGWF